MSRELRESGAPRGGRSRWAAYVLVLFGLILLALVVLQGRRETAQSKPLTATVYCFSALQDAMTEEILPAFQSAWRERTGMQVEFITTFAGSASLTDRIIDRFPAEVAVLSSEIDAIRLVGKGVLIGPTWKELPHHGVFCRSPIAILVRPGNPKEIGGFEDLAREGVSVLHADPRTSGAGEWAVLAVYGAALRASGDRSVARDLLERVWRNATIGGGSARALDASFDGGLGDAALTYEADALGPAAGGEAREFVIPARTIVSEPLIVPIARNVLPEQKELIDSLVAFFWSERVQSALVSRGFRSVDENRNAGNAAFREIGDSFTLEELGGARRAGEEILEGVWGAGIAGGMPSAGN